MIPVHTLRNRPHQKPEHAPNSSVIVGTPFKGQGELTVTWDSHARDFTISHRLGLTSFAGWGANTKLVQRREKPYCITFDSRTGAIYTPGSESPYPDRPFIIEDHSRMFALVLRNQEKLIKAALDEAQQDGRLTQSIRGRIEDRISRIRQFGAFGSSEAFSLDKTWTHFPPERNLHPHFENITRRIRFPGTQR